MEIVFASPSDDPRAASPRYVTRFVRRNASDSPLPVVMTVWAEVQQVAGSRDSVTGMTRPAVVDAEGIVAAEEVEVSAITTGKTDETSVATITLVELKMSLAELNVQATSTDPARVAMVALVPLAQDMVPLAGITIKQPPLRPRQ